MYTKEFEELVQPLAEAEGFELVECSVAKLRRSQVFLVRLDSEAGGVPVDACARLSRLISEELDQNPMLEGSYKIEVSSSGMNRKIWSAAHFRRFVGEEIKVELKVAEDQTVFIGKIGPTLEDKSFVLTLESGVEMTIEISNIEKAKLRMDPWKRSSKPKR